MQFYSIVDFVLFPFFLTVIILLSGTYARRKSAIDPTYRYYMPGLLLKQAGGIALALVYTIYYPGGDTIQYFTDSLAFQKLFFVDFNSFMKVLTTKGSVVNYQYFTSETGYPAYLREEKAWTIVKIGVFLVSFGLGSFMVTTMLCALISFFGVWKLYKVFSTEFPELRRQMAISFLFIPSVFFWGSGFLKDTFMIGALGYFVWGVYQILVLKKKKLLALFSILLSGWLILAVKPYIMVGLLPALILWILHMQISRIRAFMIKSTLLPLTLVVSIGIGYLAMQLLGEALADYQLDSILEKAVITQRDLKSDYYQGNSFDIGEFDATPLSILGKFPIATFSAIFRPLIIESNNFVMFISSLENLVILIFTVRMLFKVRFIGIFRSVFRHHLLTFSFFFSLLFAFSVGLTTSNFGSLVRYKIPCIPFYIASVFLIMYLYEKTFESDEHVTKDVINT